MTSANARTDSQVALLDDIRRTPLADLPRGDVDKVVKRVVIKDPNAPVVDVTGFSSAI
ncbi:MAG TPA: hypothetical protein VFT95_15210 [Micromonosporaceae bacterium]|nr:hypothetical protein [Micromonosporaceae bacterium]